MSANPCPFEEDVLVLGDGELDALRRVVVEAHLGICESCAELEEAVYLAESSLADDEFAPLGAADVALERLDAIHRRRARLVAASIFGIAAVLLVAFAAGLRPPRQRTPPALADRSVDGPEVGGENTHETEVADAPDIDPGSVEPEPIDPEPADLARRPLPDLPPPPPRTAHALSRRLLDLDSRAPVRAEELDALAADLRRTGGRGAAALARVLRDPDPSVADLAMSVAERMESQQLVAPLAALLSDRRLGDRAARRLGELRAVTAVRELARQLSYDTDGAVASALAEIGSESAIRALSEAFWAADVDARGRLLDAVITADAARGAQLITEALSTEGFGQETRDVADARRDVLLPELRALAAGRDVLRVRGAAAELGRLRDVASIDLLADLASAPESTLEAVGALLDVGTADAVNIAVDRALAQRDVSFIAAAFDGAASAEPELLARLENATHMDAEGILVLLGRCGGPAAARALVADELPERLHEQAIAALGGIGGDEAVNSLASYTGSLAMRRGIVAALGETGSRVAIPVLESITTDTRLHDDVAAALARLESRESVRLLIQLMDGQRRSNSAARALSAMPTGLVVPELLMRTDDGALDPMARRLLAQIAGRDLGARTAAWQQWWDARS